MFIDVGFIQVFTYILQVFSGFNAVVMDVNSGEIISSVSLPDFNPNHITKISKKHFIGRMFADLS